MNRWITAGEFGAPHGVKGAIRLRSFLEEPGDIFTLDGLVLDGADRKPLRLEKRHADKGVFIARVAGYSSREEVAPLTGRRILAPRESLGPADPEDDEFFAADLVGLEARGPDGKRLGSVESVDEYGAEPVIEVLLDTRMENVGRYALVPFRKALVPEVNIADGYVTVDWDDWFASETVVPSDKRNSKDKA